MHCSRLKNLVGIGLILGSIWNVSVQSRDIFPNLASQITSKFSVEQLKAILNTEKVQKLLRRHGIIGLSETLQDDPSPLQIRKIIEGLKPLANGNPHFLQILAKTLSANFFEENLLKSPNQKRLRYSPKIRRKSSKLERPMPHPSSITQPSAPPPILLIERRNSDSAPPPVQSVDGMLLFDHVTDPNIRNHKLYGWKNHNFTSLDQIGDSIVDETISKPSLIPLLADDENVDRNGPNHWLPSSSTSGMIDAPSIHDGIHNDQKFGPFANSKTPQLIQSRNPETSVLPGFKPSPVDNQQKIVIPEVGGHYKFNLKDRILHLERPSSTRIHGSKHTSPTSMILRNQIRPMLTRPAPSFGSSYERRPSHPYPHFQKRPSYPILHHYKNIRVNPYYNNNDITEASEKVDGGIFGGSSTLFILGGLAAASAVAAFFLPSLLPSANVVSPASVGGKGSEPSSSTSLLPTPSTNILQQLSKEDDSNDFWDEVKGLYSDLKHLAKGDLNYFESIQTNAEAALNEDEISNESTTMSSFSLPTEETTSIQLKRVKGKGRFDVQTSSPAFNSHLPSSITASTSIYVNSPSTIENVPSSSSSSLGWSKVHLKVI